MDPLNSNVPVPAICSVSNVDGEEQTSGDMPILSFKDKSKRAWQYELWRLKHKPRRVRISRDTAVDAGIKRLFCRLLALKGPRSQTRDPRPQTPS